MAAMAPGGGGGGVNPFLSDSDEDEDEVSATDERRAGLRLGAGGGLDPGSADSLSPQDPVALGSSARAGLPGEAAAAALGGPGETPARLSIDAIAAQLLRDQYLLTALELHTELLESGRELPRLRDYFSNPGNFERQSGTPPGTGAPGIPGAAGLGGAGGRDPSTTSGGGQLMGVQNYRKSKEQSYGFPVVMYGCESWTMKKAERQRIDAFELWCWRRLLRVPWTARRSNQSILKEISPGCFFERNDAKAETPVLWPPHVKS